MNRRGFLTLAGAAAAFPRVAFAQQAAKVPRIAYLSVVQIEAYNDAFRQGLADFGYVDGKNVVVSYFAAPNLADIPAYAARAVASNPDLISTSGSAAALAVKSMTSAIPVVFSNLSDPLAIGLVSSLAHPGGNVTGNTQTFPDLTGMQVGILKELVPGLRRLAILDVTDDPAAPAIVASVEAAANAVGIEAVPVKLLSSLDLASQWGPALPADVQAVYVTASNYLGASATNRPVLAALLLKTELPTLGSATPNGALNPPAYVLIGYGPEVSGLIRASGAYIAAILKGAKPADLPVQEPTVFDFAVDLDKAKALGIVIPPSILARATVVVQNGQIQH